MLQWVHPTNDHSPENTDLAAKLDAAIVQRNRAPSAGRKELSLSCHPERGKHDDDYEHTLEGNGLGTHAERALPQTYDQPSQVHRAGY